MWEAHCKLTNAKFLDDIYLAYDCSGATNVIGTRSVSEQPWNPMQNNLTKDQQSRSLASSEFSETQEASLILEIAHAQHDIHCAQTTLMECIVWEHEKIANLHRFKAKQMQDSVDCSDLNIGWINATFNNYGRSQSSVPLHDMTTMSTSLPLKAPDADSKLYFAFLVFES